MSTPSIRVRYFAAARDAAGVEEEHLLVETPMTVRDLRAALSARSSALATVLRQSRISVDLRFAADDVVIVAASEVAIIPPVAGG